MKRPCDGIAESLPGYIYEDLSDTERRQVEDHLAECPACVETLRDFREVRDVLDLDLAEIPPMPAAKPIVRPRRGRSWMTLARAATILIAFTLGGTTWFLLSSEAWVADLEQMVEQHADDAEVAEMVVTTAAKHLGVVLPMEDNIGPRIGEEVVSVDEHYRILRDRVERNSVMLAAYFQLHIGDYYRDGKKDASLAQGAYRKVFEFETEGKVADLARARLDTLVRAQPEGR